MLHGRLRPLETAQLERLHQAALQVLERTGLQIRGRFLLQALADAGCRVDFGRWHAWFRPDLVERQVEGQRGRYRMVRSSLWYPFCRELPDDDVAVPADFTCDYGFGAPTLYDYPTATFRPATRADQLAMIRLGNGLECVRAVCAPLICGDVDSRVEIIESARLLLLHTRKPGWVGTSCAAEVPHLAALASLAAGGDETTLRTAPPVFVHAYCTTSPLRLEARSCDVLEAALRYGFPVNFAPMPILGGTTPMTPAGSAVVAAAEILGGITATSLIAPDLFYFATAISGEMDMKTTQVCYATPAAILTDAALHQLFRERYGLVLNVEAGYVEARVPGMQAAFMKTYRQMAFGSTVSHSLPLGLLDNGAVFSPTQAMLDLDANRAMHMLAGGLDVDDDALCVDLIDQVGCGERTAFIETEHTLRHFRRVGWDTLFFDRTYQRADSLSPLEADRRLLDRADQAWRRVVAAQEPVELDPVFVREVNAVCDAAHAALLGT